MSEEEEPSPAPSVSDLSEFQKGQIVGAYLGGLSVKEVSQMCNVSCHVVSDILDTYKLYLEPTPGLTGKSGAGPAVKPRLKEAAPGNETGDTNAKKTASGNKAQPANEHGEGKE